MKDRNIKGLEKASVLLVEDSDDVFTKSFKSVQLMDKVSQWLKKDDSIDNGKRVVYGDLQGIDLESTLQRVGGNYRLLLRILEQFQKESKQVVTEIDLAITGNNKIALLERLHGLKGTAGNFGANKTMNLTIEIENQISKGFLPTKLIAALKDELAVVYKSIDKALRDYSNSEEKRIVHDYESAKDIKDLLSLLKKLLENYYYIDDDLLVQIEMKLLTDDKVANYLVELRKAIEVFDYTLANYILAKINTLLSID